MYPEDEPDDELKVTRESTSGGNLMTPPPLPAPPGVPDGRMTPNDAELYADAGEAEIDTVK